MEEARVQLTSGKTIDQNKKDLQEKKDLHKFCHAGNWIWFVRRQPQQQGHCFVKPRGRV